MTPAPRPDVDADATRGALTTAEQVEAVPGECRGDGRECRRNEWYWHLQSPFYEVTVGVANVA